MLPLPDYKMCTHESRTRNKGWERLRNVRCFGISESANGNKSTAIRPGEVDL